MGTIYKRKNSDFYWVRYYKDGKCYRESSKSDLKSVAKELLKKREGEIQKGALPGIHFDRVKFNELAEEFLWDRKVNNKGVKDAGYRLKQLEKHFGGMLVTRITDTHLRKYIERRLEERYIKGKLKKGAANATVNRELSALKRMFNLGAQKRPPKVDMAQVPHITMLVEDNVRKGFFERGDYLQLIEALPDYVKPICHFALWTGWRKQEVLGLTWDRVDLGEGIVRLEPGTTKNKKGRTVYLDEEMQTMLKDQRDRQREAGKITKWVFPGRDGLKRIANFYKAWEKACAEAGLGPKLFHDFRRTAVRDMVRAGISERTAMTITGHQTRSVFDRYDIVSEADLREAARKRRTHMTSQTSTVSSTVCQLNEKRT